MNILAAGAMGLPQLLLHAACRVGVPGLPTSGQRQSCASALGIAHLHMQIPHWHCATTPTTLVVIFFLWVVFKDLVGTFPCWATPATWYMSLCFVPMERRGVQPGDWWHKPSVPDPIPLNKGCLSKEKENQPPHPAGDQLQVAQKCKQHTPLLLSFSFLFLLILHTHTHICYFLTSKNKLVGFFPYWLQATVKWLHILTRFCLQTCWNICVRVVDWDLSECCTGWCSDTLVATILRMLGSMDWSKHSSMHKALLIPSPEQPSLTLIKAGSSFSSLQSADSFTNVFQQICRPL